MQKEGKKNDKKDDKTRWELMPLDCLEDIARVYTEGAKKYGEPHTIFQIMKYLILVKYDQKIE